VTDHRTQIVAQGYDAMADRFRDWRDRIEGDPRGRYLAELARRLPEGARVLELGCGAGAPDGQFLAERFELVGVDVSGEQIARARAHVPDGRFVQADFTTLAFEPESFEAVAAVYSLNHVPRELLAGLFARIYSWLVPDGFFLASLGSGNTEAWIGEWLGTSMFFSSYEPDTNRPLLAEAGFELELDELATMREPQPDGLAEATFHWVLARR
jgi:SAM-dependent methyltransferase